MTVDRWPLWPTFLAFADRQVRSLDYDPFHPVLLHLQRGMEQERALWCSTLYMAFYSMGSAWQAFELTEPLQVPQPAADRWHIGVQRRNLRASSVCQYLASLCGQAQEHGGLHAWLTHGFGHDPVANWGILIQRLESVWGNGRWGAYTTAELYQKVNQLPVQPADLGLAGATGPRRGLVALVGQRPEADLVYCGDVLRDALDQRVDTTAIPYADGFDYAMVESLLCDFGSLLKGRYYVGRDIDRMLGRMQQMEGRALVSFTPLYEARAATLAPAYLGELNGRPGGIDTVRCKVYRDHGVIADWQDDHFA